MIKVGFISLGCAKNLVDSQIMAGSLLSHGLTLAPEPEAADVVIVNTCAFIEAAREESVESILSACELKQTGNVRAVIVAGCLTQRYRKELAESLPEVDAFIGLDALENIAEIARKLLQGEKVYEVPEHARRIFDPGEHNIVFSGGPFAYLKIAEGCNHACTFCAIPGIRGRHRSRPAANIVAEAQRLLDDGYRELNLISQDTTFYGRDLRDGSRLSRLLYELTDHLGGGDDPPYWLRLLYGYPDGIGPDLIRALRELPPVCHYVDIPIQHSHPDLLRAMRRAETIDAVTTLADRLREGLPDIVIRTTCLVGFPGETDAHFEHLLAHIRATRFDHLGVFTFSPEEDTPAEKMPGRPPAAVAQRRRELLLRAQQEIVEEKARALSGTRTTALLEQPLSGSSRTWIARTPRQAPEVDGQTFVDNVPEALDAGTFVSVRYTAASGYDMTADFVDASPSASRSVTAA